MATVEVLFNNETVLTTAIEKDVSVLGRDESCDIHIDNLGISRMHSRIVREGGRYFIEDLDSSNGTFVNGEKIKRHELTDGDEAGVGKYLIIFSTSGESNPDAAPVVPTGAQAMPDSAPVGGGDNLNTFAMDGDDIRKRMEEMRKQRESEMIPKPAAAAAEAPAAATPAAAPKASAAPAPMAAIAPATSGGGGMKMIIAAVILIGVIVAILFATGVIGGGEAAAPTTPPPAANP